MSQDTWLEKFKKKLIQQDLSDNTIRGYMFDLEYFCQWLHNLQDQSCNLAQTKITDIRAYRQYMAKVKRLKANSVNRRIQAVKRLFAWAEQHKLIDHNPAAAIRFMRKAPSTQPTVLNKSEVHALLRVAGQSPHGLAKRNYALLQLILQAGLRVSEVARLQNRDTEINERSGVVRVIDGKGHREREVPLNATARRALITYITARQPIEQEEPIFFSKRGGPMTIRAIQKIVANLVERAKIKRIKVTAHTLRHTFATNYLQANPDGLVELATLMGHESLNTTAIYTKASKEKLAQAVEDSEINIYGEEDY